MRVTYAGGRQLWQAWGAFNLQMASVISLMYDLICIDFYFQAPFTGPDDKPAKISIYMDVGITNVLKLDVCVCVLG
jgi:hypothetical protein